MPLETLISRFIEQADAAQDLSTAAYPKSYRSLKIKVSFGKGNFAKVPWISFLGYGQKTNDGIYPVFLYYKTFRLLLLCYGISEETPPEAAWESIASKQTVRAFLLEHYNVSPDRYGASYVFACYQVPDELVSEVIMGHLDRLISEYEATFEGMELEPRHWIFHGNPKIFDMVGYLRDRKEVMWSVRQYKGQVKAGQTVFFWQAGQDGGVIATGTTLTDPELMNEDPYAERYVRAPDEFPENELRVRLRVDTLLAKPIKRNKLIQHPTLRKLTILISPHSTNFLISDEEYDALNVLVREGTEYARRDEEISNHHVAERRTEPYSIDQARGDLFIEPEAFQEIVELFRAKKNIILKGPPGVGKTFYSKRLAYALMGEEAPNRIRMVQFHQSYSYEDFVQGYRPSGTGFALKDGVFYRFCKQAISDPAHKYVFVIDEINRGNLSKVLGELMMLIEPDKRGREWAIPLAYGSGQDDEFYVPENIHLLGLMNTADRSLAMVDYALRRRFGFVELRPKFKSQLFRDYLIKQGASPELVDRIVTRMLAVNERIAKDTTNLGPGYCVGHSFFCAIPPSARPDDEWYRRVIKAEIEPLLREYWFDDPAQAESLVKELLLAD